MTREAQAALGTDRVELPPDQAHRAGRRHPGEKRALDALWERRTLLGVTGGVALVVAAILVLTTGSWWWIALPLGVHAILTMLVVGAVIRTTAVVETPSASALAALDEEGVKDPEQVFDAHVKSFAAGTGSDEQLVERGQNVRTSRPDEDPAGSTAEQESAITPSSEATDPGPAEPGEGGADVPDWLVFLPGGAVALLMAGAIVIPLVAGGGLLWLLVAAVWPLGLGLIAYEAISYRRARDSRGREPASSQDTSG